MKCRGCARREGCPRLCYECRQKRADVEDTKAITMQAMGMTLEAIGRVLGVGRERVAQRIRRASRRLFVVRDERGNRIIPTRK